MWPVEGALIYSILQSLASLEARYFAGRNFDCLAGTWVASRTGCATRAVEAVLDSIASTLKSGDQVTLSGFGTFSVASRAARTGRNPRTGESISIPASKNPKFKAGKGLKDAVN